MTIHFMGRTEITHYNHEIPDEIRCVCGCPEHTVLTGCGHTLSECALDLQAKFDAHEEGR